MGKTNKTIEPENEAEDDSVDCSECIHIDCEEDCDNEKSYFYGDWVGDNSVRYCKYYENSSSERR